MSSQDTIDNLLTNLGNGQWAHPKLRDTIQHTLDDGTSFRGFRIDHEFEAVGPRSLTVSGNRKPVDLEELAEAITAVVSTDASRHSEGRPESG